MSNIEYRIFHSERVKRNKNNERLGWCLWWLWFITPHYCEVDTWVYRSNMSLRRCTTKCSTNNRADRWKYWSCSRGRDRQISIWRVADELDTSKTSLYEIMSDYLRMKKVGYWNFWHHFNAPIESNVVKNFWKIATKIQLDFMVVLWRGTRHGYTT